MTCHSVWSNTLDVSAAAKMHFIPSMDEKPVDAQTIDHRVGDLGWDLSTEKIRGVIRLLKGLACQPPPEDDRWRSFRQTDLVRR